MNPDGFERVTRGNFRGVDLNMDFPTWQQVGQGQADLTRGRQPEVRVTKQLLTASSLHQGGFHDELDP